MMGQRSKELEDWRLDFIKNIAQVWPGVKPVQVLAIVLFLATSLLGIIALIFDGSGVLGFSFLYMGLVGFIVIDKFEVWQFVAEVKLIREQNVKIQEKFIDRLENRTFFGRQKTVEFLFEIFDHYRGSIKRVKNTAYYQGTGSLYFEKLSGYIARMVIEDRVAWRECVVSLERIKLITDKIQKRILRIMAI